MSRSMIRKLACVKLVHKNIQPKMDYHDEFVNLVLKTGKKK